MAHTRRLDPVEERVAGALMEKQQVTPDAYPMTVKALRAACNQKTNRDPVMSLSEGEVRDALESLRRDVLVWRSPGARVERWEHRLESRWHLQRRELALMTLLMLRGPQTPGELRARSERLCEFESVAQVQGVLEGMADGDHPLVREGGREPGQRESRWHHLMGRHSGSGEEGPATTEPTSGDDRPAAPRAVEAPCAAEDGAFRSDLEQRVALLERRVEALEELLTEPGD